MIVCSRCEARNPDDAAHCYACGDELFEEQRLSTEELAEVARRAQLMCNCRGCGTTNCFAAPRCAVCGNTMDRAPLASDEQAVSDAMLTLTLLFTDDTEGGTCWLQGPEAIVGCNTREIFAGDPYLEPKHARFFRDCDGRLFIEDIGSVNGVLLRVNDVTLTSGDLFRLGRQLIRFASHHGTAWGELEVIAGRDADSQYLLKAKVISIGTEQGDIRFTDESVAPLHATLSRAADGTVSLTDLGGASGTFLRLRSRHELHFGDEVLIGQQRFRVDDPKKALRSA